ncbi:MAG: sulfite exporter TauE/SafE family protein [Alphaproteobacteria bacterium]|nr:sulfite exporter TauE/SafE family protein [Alphaproteobacteria bacterium]
MLSEILDFNIIVLITAAFGAGILNTIAGGGTFLTFPALVFTGVPPVAANATSAVAVFPGYLGGAVGFGSELKAFDRSILIRLTVITILGGALGSGLLIVSSNQAFSIVVPFLLLFATIVFLFNEDIRRWTTQHRNLVSPYGSVGIFLMSIYGGYFNGGLGIVFLALFALWGMENIHQMNGLKSGLSFALSAVSVLIFSIGSMVEWYEALVMMIASTAGGYVGAPIARVLPKTMIRLIITLVGFTMSGVFFWRLF